MKKYKVRLPIWKAYLYSLLKRYRRFLWINKGMLEFGMSKKETGILHGMIHKYLRKEVLRQVKAIQYYELVEEVLSRKIAVATKEEIQVANKLIITHKIKTRSLIMEMKQLKEFAKEVGLDAKKIKGMDEEELTLEIVKNLDADTTYSDEFVEWYEELPEEMFDEADAIEEEPKGKKGKGKKEEVEEEVEEMDFSELIEMIEEASDIDELTEIGQDDDYEEIFAEVDFDTKLVKKLKKSMLNAIELYKENAEEKEEVKEKEKPKAKGKKEKEEVKEEEPKKKAGRPAKEKKEVEISEEDKKEMVEAIEEAESAEDLKEVADSAKEDYPELFAGISFRQGRGKSPYREDVDAIKAEMLERLGEELEEEETEEELEITAETVNDAVEAEDKETLQAMCEQLGIELSVLMKKSVKKMSEKILEKLPKESKKTEKRTDKGETKKGKEKVVPVEEETEESKSLFDVIAEMVEEGAKEKDIIAAATPFLEERGKKGLFIKKWVKSMIAVVESLSE